jgi:hypothetical protein
MMITIVPDQPKIYHILHLDRLASVLASGGLWSDSKVLEHSLPGTTIGAPSSEASDSETMVLLKEASTA